MDILSSLNEKQKEAVLTTEGYLRVIAGAGSGKTKLLVSRYAYLVKEYGIDSAAILCVTFTNKAAGEMKRRIRSIIGQEYDTSLICTYHGFCARVLREDGEKIFYPKEFQIIDSMQQKSILGDIYQKFELKLDFASFEKTLEYISKIKAKRSYVVKMCTTEKCQILDNIVTLDDRIAEEFMQRQKQIYAVDFSDLMYFTIDLFERHREVLEKWQDKLNYIQVDEFQDSSRVEMELIDKLSGKYRNLMIVGDPDQNIYEWRGSDVKLLVDFDKEHVPTKTIFLNQNYRSTPQILRCANALISKNRFRLKKDLFTKSENGSDVIHYHVKSEYEEAGRIAEQIGEIRKSTGCRYSDFAVLYRSGFLSRIIEKKFTENGIPYEIYGGVKFYQRMEIQDIIAYLRLVVFDDDASFKRVVNTPRRRFGRVKMLRLVELQSGGSLFSTLKENIEDPVLKNSGAADFVNIIEQLRSQCGTVPLSEIVEKVCADTGYEKYIRELGDMERFENLSEFKRISSEYEKSFGESVPVREFINHISLQSGENNGEESDMVKLMTIHAAKGLEFTNVFVVGFSEGIFPSSKTIEERKNLGLEEERRLCYVAITRAEKRLFLLDSEGFTQNGGQKLPSRFLKEIGEENYVRIGVVSKELQDASEKFAEVQIGETVRNEGVLEIGSAVLHPAFGEGKIVGYVKNKNIYRVQFEKLSCTRDISADFFNRAAEKVCGKDDTSENTVSESTDVVSGSASSTVSAVRIAGEDAVSESADVVSGSASSTVSAVHSAGEDAVSENTAIESEFASDAAFTGHSDNENSEPESTAAEDAICENADNENISGGGMVEKPSDKSSSEDYQNLWEQEDVPKRGWVCTGITDLGEPSGICEMCGHQIIRYVHHMIHPAYHQLNVGCICAGKMEGSVERARKRERDFKNRQSRFENFMNREWKISRNSNSYLKIKNHLIVLYQCKTYSRNEFSHGVRSQNSGGSNIGSSWKYSLDSVFCSEAYKTAEECKAAAFDALERILS